MKLSHRRQLLHLAVGAVALPAVSRFAWAQTYPTRTVRIIVGYPAGSSPDLFARLLARWLSDRLGQQFAVENRPSANIAAEMVVRAPPDGYTLLMANGTNAINATLYPNLNFNFIRDIAPVAIIGRTPVVLAVNPSLPAKTLDKLIENGIDDILRVTLFEMRVQFVDKIGEVGFDHAWRPIPDRAYSEARNRYRSSPAVTERL
jgi:tripartite-type tricarboxylate transporter receptor subunit TctC